MVFFNINRLHVPTEKTLLSSFLKGYIEYKKNLYQAVFKIKIRTIMIFPEFDNIWYVDELRKKYDPLTNKVRPHITLVFPFESNLSKNEIFDILNNRLNKIAPFEIEVQGLSVSDCWLVLNVSNSSDIITNIHNILYKHEFFKYKPIWLNEYIPHITVGKFNFIEEANNAYDQEKYFDKIFNCMINKISVEIIGDDEESIIEIEYPLHKN